MTTQELYQKYPKIFELMKDGYYSISSEVPEGWMRNVDLLCECIQGYTNNINNNNKHLPSVPQVIAEQIKEKFAGLRFYYIGGDDKIEGMVEFAETLCEHTCMSCGKEGKQINQNGWLSVYCDECLTK